LLKHCFPPCVRTTACPHLWPMAPAMAGSRQAPQGKMAVRKKAPAAGGQARLGGENSTTAELEAIVFGTQLQLPPSDVEDESASDTEAAVALGVEVPLTTDFKVARPKAKRKLKKKRKKVGPVDDDEDGEAPGGGGCAWHDPDDAELEVDLTMRNRTKKLRLTDEETKVTGDEYEQRLRDQFVKMNGSVGWAEKRPDVKDSDASDSEEDVGYSEPVASSAAPIVESASRGLRPGQVDIKCLQRVEIPSLAGGAKAAVVQSIHFHPDSELMLSAGLDKTLRIFAVDGTENAKVAAYFFKKFPITGAAFTPDGDQVLITGREFKMWGLDVRTGEPSQIKHHSSIQHTKYRGLATGPCPADAPSLRANKMYSVLGDAGTVLVCDVPSKQPVRMLRMSAPAVASVFSEEHDVLWSADADCNIYEWDLATGRCKQRIKAAWATGIESLALRRVTPNAPTSLLAIGTASGNIDLYDTSGPKLSAEPFQTIGNLTTAVTTLKFQPQGELLLGASKFKKDSLRLMHCATASVYQNWPTAKTPLNRVTCVDFSRQGGMMAMANERGKVLLYQLRHYGKPA